MERSEYEPVRLPLGRAGLSILLWLALFLYTSSYDWSRPMGSLVLGSSALLLTGTWLAWSSRKRRGQNRLVARAGLLLNLGGLVCVLVPVSAHYAMVWISG